MSTSVEVPWYKRWWAVTLFIFFGLAVLGNLGGKSSKPNTNNPEQTATVLDLDSVSTIEKAIRATGDYEVTVWTLDGNFANVESNPPFEVIVIASAGQIQDCFDAKNKLFNAMEAVYSNEQIKDKIARIKFGAWGQLQASLGSKDAIGLDWRMIGLSNFWKVLQQYKSYEDESGPLDERTYGVRLNSSCE